MYLKSVWCTLKLKVGRGEPLEGVTGKMGTVSLGGSRLAGGSDHAGKQRLFIDKFTSPSSTSLW